MRRDDDRTRELRRRGPGRQSGPRGSAPLTGPVPSEAPPGSATTEGPGDERRLPSAPALRRIAAGAAALLVVLFLVPRSDTATRLGSLLAAGTLVVAGLLLLRGRGRTLALLGLGSAAALLCLPAREDAPAKTRRTEFTEALLLNRGTPYVWGGESVLGIDCSGLVRRALVTSILSRALRTADPGRVRQAFILWWRDRSARDLLAGHELTRAVLDAESLDALAADPAATARLLPGDLAVTRDGLHVLAWIGEGRWIEADPGLGEVVVVTPPAPTNPWFGTPVRIVRLLPLE